MIASSDEFWKLRVTIEVSTAIETVHLQINQFASSSSLHDCQHALLISTRIQHTYKHSNTHHGRRNPLRRHLHHHLAQLSKIRPRLAHHSHILRLIHHPIARHQPRNLPHQCQRNHPVGSCFDVESGRQQRRAWQGLEGEG
jgi:hypothetical protein